MPLSLLKKNKAVKFVLYWHLDIVRQKILDRFFHRQNIKLLERALLQAGIIYMEVNILIMFERKCVIIPCCVQTDRILTTPDMQNRAENIRSEYSGKTILFSAGSLVPYKGFEYLIEAADYITDDFVILIAGAGKGYSKLRKKIGFNKKIKLLGKVSDEELNLYYITST